MLKCNQCDFETEKIQSLNAHQNKHSNNCKSYHQSRTITIIKTFCKNEECKKEIQFEKGSKEKIFCSNSCQRKHQWLTETQQKILKGQCFSKASLKRFLIEKSGNKCSECPTGNIWNGKILVLQLDHIDGNRRNNKPENLRLLCPNCHSQTETWGYNNPNRYHL